MPQKKIDSILFEYNAPVIKSLKGVTMCVISKPHSHDELENHAVTAATIASALSFSDELMNEGSRRKGHPNIPRQRKSAEATFASLGPTCSKRVCRMRIDCFHKLHDFLHGSKPNTNKRKRGATQNGTTTRKAKLSMALRFFAGGYNHGIGGHHGVHSNVVCDAVW